MVHDMLEFSMQVGEPNENCEDDYDGKPGSSKLAMGLKLATAGAELVDNLGQLLMLS